MGMDSVAGGLKNELFFLAFSQSVSSADMPRINIPIRIDAQFFVSRIVAGPL